MKLGRNSRTRYSLNVIKSKHRRRLWLVLPGVLLVIVIGVYGYREFSPAEASVEKTVSKLQFDTTVSSIDKEAIAKAINDQDVKINGSNEVSVLTGYDQGNDASVLGAYVPIANLYSTRQTVSKAELGELPVSFPSDMPKEEKQSIIDALNIEAVNIQTIGDSVNAIADTTIAIIPIDQLTSNIKLLRLDDGYYLDTFQSGAIFRRATFSGDSATTLDDLKLNDALPTKETVFKINQTGVTALTRLMMKKLNQVGDPKYFSEYIGDYLADADITHVSNESSFQNGCAYSNTVLCSDPRFIETLKDSGVDLVELTGNHNNDVGAQYNTETINLYHSLGWKTFGGGLNTVEAAKFYVTDQKKSKVAFLGYNYPDSPNGGAIAHTSTAGANSFNIEKIKKDIQNAKNQSNFVIVDVQFWECYAYPDGYVEFPECDKPIGDQKAVFQQIVDSGADMVVGTQAHQPQTYEIYKGKPIYYGLGNLYFDQTQWPGTERGIILTHYFVAGKLVQTKLSPTVYDSAYQTRLMTNDESEYLLERLDAAR